MCPRTHTAYKHGVRLDMIPALLLELWAAAMLNSEVCAGGLTYLPPLPRGCCVIDIDASITHTHSTASTASLTAPQNPRRMGQ